MKPKRSPQHNRQEDLFRSELSQIIDPCHPLVKLAGTVDWDRLVTAARKRGIVLRQNYNRKSRPGMYQETEDLSRVGDSGH